MLLCLTHLAAESFTHKKDLLHKQITDGVVFVLRFFSFLPGVAGWFLVCYD